MSSTFDVKVSGYLRRNGVRYKPGDVIRGLTEQEAQNLVRLGVAESVIKIDAAPSSAPVDSPPDPSTPWGLVALSAEEAAKRIAKVENPKVLRAVEALEELRDKPRSTVLKAIEARRQEIEPPAPSTPPADPPSNKPADPPGNADGGSTLEPSQDAPQDQTGKGDDDGGGNSNPAGSES